MGPLGVRTYAGAQWTGAGKRPPIAPDYGGHDHNLWVFGALEPATGRVITHTDIRRTRHEFISFLDQVVRFWPEGKLVFILDNLSVHKTLDVQLWALAHARVRFLFQPTYSPWLNLIEPWWHTLRNLALKGRAFTQTEQMALAIQHATDYWLAHRHPYRWRKAA
jgi:transposase